jgi:hypothetical protein
MTFDNKNQEEMVFSLVLVILSICMHINSLLLLMVRRICIMFDVCCEKLRRYFYNIIDKPLFFLVIRQKWRSICSLTNRIANKMAKKMPKKTAKYYGLSI